VPHAWHQGEFTISTHPARLDFAVVHGFLAGSDWATGIPRETVRRAPAGRPAAQAPRPA